MILGTIAWAFYSWLLARTHAPKEVRQDWAAFLMAQLVFGLAWSGALAAGEWTLTAAHIDLGWPLLAAMAFIGIGPAVVAYRCWGTGVQRAGPQAASIFMNLTPLFAAVLSAAFLREAPHWYHGVAFLLIVGGIVVASRR
jgi:drug/metabolite transporter (DMT)-like permease